MTAGLHVGDMWLAPPVHVILRALVAAAAVLAPKAALASASPETDACAGVLFRPGEGDLRPCRVPLLGALVRDEVPGYRYNALDDCHFWAHFGVRDRVVENSRELAFTRLMELRLSEPFAPPLRRNGSALYVGAHRGGEDGVVLHRLYGLRMHLFEPSPTFFAELRRAVGNISAFTLHNYGLGLQNREAQLRLDGTGSTTLGEHVPRGLGEEIRVRSAARVVQELGGGGEWELLHVNCEGCEYDIIQGLHDAGRLADFAHIQLATHMLEAPAEALEMATSPEEAQQFTLEVSAKRYCEAHRLLALTHERSWGTPWVWERWTRRRDVKAAG